MVVVVGAESRVGATTTETGFQCLGVNKERKKEKINLGVKEGRTGKEGG